MVPAVGSVELKQGGLHLMFMGVPATPTFEKAGAVEIALALKAQGTIGAQH